MRTNFFLHTWVTGNAIFTRFLSHDFQLLKVSHTENQWPLNNLVTILQQWIEFFFQWLFLHSKLYFTCITSDKSNIYPYTVRHIWIATSAIWLANKNLQKLFVTSAYTDKCFLWQVLIVFMKSTVGVRESFSTNYAYLITIL